MDKELKIQRFKATQEMLAGLKDEQFDFKDFVSDYQDGCGTVCCALGWYPVYFPESKLEWQFSEARASIGSVYAVLIKASAYHGVDREVIGRIFMIDYADADGELQDSYSKDEYEDGITRQDVINRIQEYIDKIEEGEEV